MYPKGLKPKEYYLYKLGASDADECPPNIQTLPTTNHIAKKQSRAILKYSIRTFSLQPKNQRLK